MFKIPFFRRGSKEPPPVIVIDALDKFLTPSAKKSLWWDEPNFDYSKVGKTYTVTKFWETPYYSVAEWIGNVSEEGGRGELRSVQLRGLLNIANEPGCVVRITAAAYREAPPAIQVLLKQVAETRMMPVPRPLGEDYGSVFIGELIIDGVAKTPPMTVGDLPAGAFHAKGVFFYPLD